MSLRCSLLLIALLGAHQARAAADCADAGAMFAAAYAGNTALIKEYQAAQCALDEGNAAGFTLYDIAALSGNKELKSLLEQSHAAKKDQYSPALVRLIQTGMRYINRDAGPIDGVYNEDTRRAVKGYQKSLGQNQSGSISGDWLAPFYKELVKTAQKDLKRLGYGGGSADGIIGANTRKAMQAFRSREDLPNPDFAQIDHQLIYQLMIADNEASKIAIEKREKEALAAQQAAIAAQEKAKREAEKRRRQAQAAEKARREAEARAQQLAAQEAEARRRAQLAEQEAQAARQAQIARQEQEAQARLAQLQAQAEAARQAEAAQQQAQAEAARQAELNRQAQAAQQAEAARQAELNCQAEAARQAELNRQAQAAQQAEAARQAELNRQAEAARQAELTRQAEAARQAQLAREQAEAARLAAEQARQREAAAQAERAAAERRAQEERARQESLARQARLQSASTAVTVSGGAAAGGVQSSISGGVQKGNFQTVSGTLSYSGGENNCSINGRKLDAGWCRTYFATGANRQCDAVISKTGTVLSLRCK